MQEASIRFERLTSDGPEGDVIAELLKSLMINPRVLEPMRLEERRFDLPRNVCPLPSQIRQLVFPME